MRLTPVSSIMTLTVTSQLALSWLVPYSTAIGGADTPSLQSLPTSSSERKGKTKETGPWPGFFALNRMLPNHMPKFIGSKNG